MGRVFVTGASGFLGLHLVRELRALGHEVRGLSRTEAADAKLQALGALSVRGDLADASALQRGCEGAQAVFHTAISRLTRRMPDVTPEAVALACHDLVVDSGKAEAELGYERTPLPALLSDTIAWMRQEGLLRG